MDYLTVRCVGFITYCDALIARLVNSEFQAFLFSLIGSPSHIQATSAVLFGSDICQVVQNDETALPLRFSPGTIRTYRNRKIGEIVNKIMINVQYFLKPVQSAVIFGPDVATVQDRAFLCIDAATSIPLKPQWRSWLWDEVLQPEKLYSFGGEDLRGAYLISWPDEHTLEERILEGVRQKYLT